MRDRVVRVDDVEFIARDLDDSLASDRSIAARGTADRRASRRGGRSGRLILAESKRHVGAEDVDIMAARGERFRELGRDNPAPADRCVADDADVTRSLRGSPKRSSP